jgi:hypothetical protein
VPANSLHQVNLSGQVARISCQYKFHYNLSWRDLHNAINFHEIISAAEFGLSLVGPGCGTVECFAIRNRMQLGQLGARVGQGKIKETLKRSEKLRRSSSIFTRISSVTRRPVLLE